LLLKLQQKTIGIAEALNQLKALPTELHATILEEAQRSFQALPDNLQNDLLLEESIQNLLNNSPSHPIFADRQTSQWKTYTTGMPNSSNYIGRNYT